MLRSRPGGPRSVIMVSALPGPRLSGLASVTPAAAVGGFSLLVVLVYVADEYLTSKAGAGTLEASVVGLYGIVIMVVGVYPRCVHKSSLWAGLRGAPTPAGPFLYPTA